MPRLGLEFAEFGARDCGRWVMRLDSWKEIARYLHRDESTVQRWEKREGMPVHRHLHEKRGSVYAFTPELDAWWQGRRPVFRYPTPLS